MMTLERLGHRCQGAHLSNDFHTPQGTLKQKLQGTTRSLGKEGVSHNHSDRELCDLGSVPEPLWVSVPSSVNGGVYIVSDGLRIK